MVQESRYGSDSVVTSGLRFFSDFFGEDPSSLSRSRFWWCWVCWLSLFQGVLAQQPSFPHPQCSGGSLYLGDAYSVGFFLLCDGILSLVLRANVT